MRTHGLAELLQHERLAQVVRVLDVRRQPILAKGWRRLRKSTNPTATAQALPSSMLLVVKRPYQSFLCQDAAMHMRHSSTQVRAQQAQPSSAPCPSCRARGGCWRSRCPAPCDSAGSRCLRSNQKLLVMLCAAHAWSQHARELHA